MNDTEAPSPPSRSTGAVANAAGFEALWQAVLKDWDEERVHDAFVSYCSQADNLVKAASRYREVEKEPERAERAKKQLEKISALALAQMAALPRSEKVERNGLLWFALVVIVGAVLGWIAVQIM